MLDRTTALRRMKTVGWLAATPDWFSSAVLERSSLHEFEKGEWIYRVGQTGDGLWGVAEGGLHVEFTQGVHAPRTGIFASVGFWTGEGSLIVREARSVGLRTTRPTQMVHLSQKAFMTIASAHGEAWRWVGLLTFFHMVNVIGLREDLCLKDPEMRVLATLSRMTGTHWGGPPRSDDGSGPGVTIDISQGDLAELCNVSRAFLSGILVSLKNEGLVEPGYGSIRFPDPGALRDRMMVEH